MLQEAREAAESVKHLQALYEMRDDDKFKISGVRFEHRGSLPGLHLDDAVLEAISGQGTWIWSERDCDTYPHMASVTMFGVRFFAIFSAKAAATYGGIDDEVEDKSSLLLSSIARV